MSFISANEDARYRGSSQFRLWSMSPAALTLQRRENNRVAKDQIARRIEQIWDFEKTPAAERNMPVFLTADEELKLVNFNTNELLRAGAFLEFPIEVLATGAALFRRFYVANSIMTYAPTQILKSALFLAAKVEFGFDRVARRFEQLPKTSIEEVLAGETVLAVACGCVYDVRHPFRSLEGAILELRRSGQVEERRLTQCRDHARSVLKFSPLMTDAYFHYTSAQIMLAAISIADRGLAEMLVSMLFQVPHANASGTSTPASGGSTPLPPHSNPASAAFVAQMRDKVLGTVEACRDMLKTEPLGRGEYWSTGPGSVETKPLRRKLKWCHDPDRWDLVRFQKMRSLGKKSSRQKVKDEIDDPFAPKSSGLGSGPETKRRKVDDDPFGPPLG